MFLKEIRNVFVSRTQILCPQQMLRARANGETFVSATMCPQHCVLVCHHLIDDIKVVESKPPLSNQHCVVYKFSCDLCDADYVGYTSRHPFGRIADHKYSATGEHLKEDHIIA